MVLLQVRHVQDPSDGTGNQDASYGGVCYSEDLEYLQYDKDPLVRAWMNNDRAVPELEENYECNRQATVAKSTRMKWNLLLARSLDN